MTSKSVSEGIDKERERFLRSQGEEIERTKGDRDRGFRELPRVRGGENGETESSF